MKRMTMMTEKQEEAIRVQEASFPFLITKHAFFLFPFVLTPQKQRNNYLKIYLFN